MNSHHPCLSGTDFPISLENSPLILHQLPQTVLYGVYAPLGHYCLSFLEPSPPNFPGQVYSLNCFGLENQINEVYKMILLLKAGFVGDPFGHLKILVYSDSGL